MHSAIMDGDEDLTKMETEEIRVGNWQSRIPSDVATNKEIFDDIFSLETWNNVLTPEQQERLTNLLPKEIAADGESARKTIEELFNRNLTSFDQNPLNNFYEQLEKGQYDPDVVDMKKNIMKEWKKESLRQLKGYHARLLEDIVVSRQMHLNRAKASTPSKVGKKGSAKSKKKVVGVLQNASSELNSKSSVEKKDRKIKQEKKSTTATPTVTLNSTNASNSNSKKRKIKTELTDPLADSGSPKPKKAANSKTIMKITPTTTTDGSKNTPEIIQKMPPASLYVNNTSGMTTPTTTTKILASSKLFPQQHQVITTSSILMGGGQQNSILSSALLGDKSSSHHSSSLNIATSLSQLLKSTAYTSPTLTSPILASQLQASPQVSVKVEDSLGSLFSSSESITLNYQKIEDKSSDDDLETSSDEFEAIQPTIGFGTNVVPSGILSPTATAPSKISSSSATGQINPNLLSSYSGGFANKFIQLQSDGRFIAVSAAGQSSKDSPVYLVSTKNFPNLAGSGGGICLQSGQQQGRIISVPKGALLDQLPMMSGGQILSSSKPDVKPLLKLEKGENHITTQSQSPLLDQLMQKSTPNFPMHSEFTRVANSSGGISHQGNTIFATSTKSSATTGGLHCISTSTGKSLILHSMPSGSIKSSPLMPNISSHSYMNSQHQMLQHFVTSQSRMMTNDNDTSTLTTMNSTGNLLDGDELNLNLGLGGNICIGGPLMDSISDPLAGGDGIDKIDDLSVLDGNPFDSIPNLSDELDGLDLDLVDGLCDFDGLLSDEKKYPSFFSLIRDVLCSTRDHRMNLLCLEKTIRKWTTSPGAALNQWFLRVSDWNNALVTALNFLAGTYQDVHPEDFVPYIEYKYKTKYYQWIGAGRDGDNNLTPLCGIWMENLEKLPSVKKIDGETEDQEEDDEENEDSEMAGEDAKKKNKRPQTPPPPRCVTDWSVRPSTEDEKQLFRKQERTRFENPHKAFTYTMHGYESVVGPVKGVYSSQVGMTNKARGHSLLVDDRPPYVTILALVRDAVARLPNGEGTRSEICEMLRDSAFLAPDASSVTLNSVVSGALDRLHYERDPCVRYDSHKKSWIYLHRDRTQEQFERLHHNRSYTKSTKSRNNTARKSRRSTAGKGGNSTAGNTAATTPTTTEDTGHLTPTSVTSTSCSSGHDSLTDTLSQGISILPDKPTTPSTLPTMSLTTAGGENTTSMSVTVTSSGGSSLLPTLRLASIPDNSTASLQSSSTHFITTTSSFSSLGQAGSQQPQQYTVVQTAGTPITSSANVGQNTIQFQAGGRPVQVKAVSVNNTAENNSTNLPVQTIQTSQQIPTSQGQIMFAPSTVLRLANALRLSQLRLPGNNAIGGNVRLPQQHRILLTRGSIPGQNQTQGILLGQTSTGQTVILSTAPPGSHHLGGFQSLQQLSSNPQFHELNVGVSSSESGSTTTPPTTTYTLKPISGGGMSMSSTPSNNSPTINVGGGNNIVLNIAGGGGPSSAKSSPSMTATSNATVTMSQGFQSHEFITTGSNTFNRQPMGYTIATVRGNTMAIPTRSLAGGGGGPATIQLQSLGQTLNTPQQNSIVANLQHDNNMDVNNTSNQQQSMTSPIIIRSVQGDIMLPGHIALGKGVQGIKLIPLPMGNKTVLAKIIPPTTSTPRMTLGNTNTATSNPATTFTIAKPASPAVTQQNQTLPQQNNPS